MNKNFYADMLTRKPKLIQAMIDFNTHEESMTTPQNWRHILQKNTLEKDATQAPLHIKPLITKFIHDPSIRKVLKQKVLNNDNLAYTLEQKEKNQNNLPHFFWDFAENSRRLALLNRRDITSLILYFGAAISAKEIAHCILKKDVQKIHASLGTELYSYAISRGQYTLTSIKPAFTHFYQKHTLYERIVLQGAIALFILYHTWPEGLQAIFLPIIQKALKQLLQHSKESQNPNLLHELDTLAKQISTPDITRSLKFNMKKILITEVESAWAQYLD